ncbi:hypothetical protein OHB26_18405 [Nocardia sp. NBC_01503]|uniref:hypothetical protein n=1 Tax=Nocardia TaxID=1817 RepID=UPI000831A931|nr:MULTISPECIES: hypothetical protein [Nocardia]WTL35991.1 hypothetical protein OHB26_18405 [Nocardia sp. NBC_01503]
MKKLIVTAGLIVGCAAGAFAPASAAPMYDPWTACKASGLSDEACSQQVNANDPATTPGAGFGWTGSAAAR